MAGAAGPGDSASEDPAAGPGFDARRGVGRDARLGEAVYGTIVLLAQLSYLSDQEEDALVCVLTVTGTALVLYIARLYATLVATRIVAPPESVGTAVRVLAGETWPVGAVAAPAVVLLTIAELGGMTVAVALSVGGWIYVLGLGLFTYGVARAAHAGVMRRLLSTAASLAVGLFIVVLKSVFD